MWILMEVGCICTGRHSRVVGRFSELVKAQKIQWRLEEKYGLPSGGERVFRILPEPYPETINDAYEL